ncbi:MAG: 30S ribosomal protein S10 [Candidatus Nomurabacteria bacterium GW2011_GWA2_43_66]|uniref:Small ribosomal subunit protein uS10 n=1 Tax=Candidatus Nomurabacteria bacterium GW2011_GWF2_43_24 TaxID=1618778 RepID=A0A0G1HKZ5_9BACT|nr:MAG: 30S ribosomal protein S10 [Parcubacteria group bacterium GW2011_GWC1_42_21]KKS58740.1 MAG: 30S ribosomal protein S10 [Candidatus Nomurabacteria bacterium GW2011_GWF1_42_40]KKT00064.1 MAG: 30S ribosomal protein S10 [Candidatus Nomurabacteria bacterium GW2011_GWA1_43_17]KKT07999.1 MAG: 30S ribosomal protein S10 [Candidatus Nomurabacteria bacterium GW2011_GWB1_43_19]KKT11549.1 MAG: 30S ribosomal protein S10 [Candidatus Nomurabacteria bacterium GW2011_GWF2_43_24]KKT18081.1 MAG: 30S ribosom
MTTTETKIKKPRPTASGGVPHKAGKTAKAPKTAKVSVKKGKFARRAPVGAESKVVLRIRVRAYESKILDASVKQIMDTAVRYDAVIIGPVPLPTEIKKYTVNRSAFIYKNTREQFEIRVHKRLIDIINPNAKTVEALTNLTLPSGVDIDVKMM